MPLKKLYTFSRLGSQPEIKARRVLVNRSGSADRLRRTGSTSISDDRVSGRQPITAGCAHRSVQLRLLGAFKPVLVDSTIRSARPSLSSNRQSIDSEPLERIIKLISDENTVTGPSFGATVRRNEDDDANNDDGDDEN